MDRIREITFVFPQNNEAEKVWGTHFCKMLNEIPSIGEQSTALPRIGFRWEERMLPAVVWSNYEQSDRPISLGSNIEHSTSKHEDAITIEQLYRLIKGRIIGMDHAGVNIPTASMPPSEWTVMLSELMKMANLYRYPGEDWPFILPAEEEEFMSDITDFSIKRTPKFELVYDTYTKLPIFQFALETNLSRYESEKLFPEPVGFEIPGLGEIFRSIFICHPWEGQIAIRFDLYHMPTNQELSDWETGEWLVVNGGRIRS